MPRRRAISRPDAHAWPSEASRWTVWRGQLVPVVRRGVIDRTGLSGYFDGDFDISAEFGPPPPPPGVRDPLDRPSLASLFSVFPEQLGLRLEPTRGPVEVVVIDAIEKPTAN